MHHDKRLLMIGIHVALRALLHPDGAVPAPPPDQEHHASLQLAMCSSCHCYRIHAQLAGQQHATPPFRRWQAPVQERPVCFPPNKLTLDHIPVRCQEISTACPPQQQSQRRRQTWAGTV